MKKTSKVTKSLSAASAGVLAFALSSSAAVRTVQLSPSDFIDTEASTNVVFAPLQEDTRQYVMRFAGEGWHHEPLGDRRRSHHLTAVTQHGSTEPVTVSMTQMMAEGVSAYVAVYMASSEYGANPAYDDSVSWSITSNSGGSMSGSASVMGQWSALEGVQSWDNELYGVVYDPLFLGGQMFAAPSDEVLRLSLTATAQNATDGLRETCVQIVVYSVDGSGNIIGLPSWVNPN